jgi:hypothetical protein
MTGKALWLFAASAFAASVTVPPGADLTVHEWGTFTSVAGADGQAVPWLALTGSTNLPDFVEHLPNARFSCPKCDLIGTIRMETPVMYFYTPHETTVSVNVKLSEGTITEWYPHATSADGTIRWGEVRLLPGSREVFPSGGDGNHYYEARNTGAVPLRVKAAAGEQNEKFLFYRGVGSAPLPIAATIMPSGKVNVRNLGSDEIPSVMLIESRGGRLGYRMGGGLAGQTLLEPPELTAPREAMLQDLEKTLVAQGLYQDEARAMIATWQNSWFEEGSRLLYILPASAVNRILPLTLKPAPAQTARVFVGRLELVTPATEHAIEQAFAQHDQQTLDEYRRFLEPILKVMIAQSELEPARKQLLVASLNSVYKHSSASPWQSKTPVPPN